MALILLLIFVKENMGGWEFKEEKSNNFILLSLIISHILSPTTFSYKIESSCVLFIEVQIL